MAAVLARRQGRDFISTIADEGQRGQASHQKSHNAGSSVLFGHHIFPAQTLPLSLPFLLDSLDSQAPLRVWRSLETAFWAQFLEPEGKRHTRRSVELTRCGVMAPSCVLSERCTMLKVGHSRSGLSWVREASKPCCLSLPHVFRTV